MTSVAASAQSATDAALYVVGSLPSPHQYVADADVYLTRDLVAQMGILEPIAEWEEVGRKGPGGAPKSFGYEPLVVAMTLCARQNKPMLVSEFCNMMFVSFSDEARASLGIPAPAAADDQAGLDAQYRNVRTRLHSLLDLMDPSLLPKNRVMPGAEFLELAAKIEAERGDKSEMHYQRLSWFCNQVIGVAFWQLPRRVRRKWKGSLGVDATRVPAFGNFDKRGEKKKGQTRRSQRELLRSSSDPDAGVYGRQGNHDGDAEPNLKDGEWAHELTIAVMASDEPEKVNEFPNLVMGMPPLHRPGAAPGRQAIEALRSIRDRGHPAGYFVGDRAYSDEKPENLQLPARALGYELVFDYRKDQLGIQLSSSGAIMVEGRWYSPSMPDVLVRANLDFYHPATEDDRIDTDTWQVRLKAREGYELRPNGLPDSQGHQRWLCPASGAAPTMVCPHKPGSSKATGKPTASLTKLLQEQPPAICRQSTITIAPEDGAKFAQDLRYKTPEWQGVYGLLRALIEGSNGDVKDGSYEALGDATRRRVRGIAAQSLFVAFLLLALNLRRIDTFLKMEVVDPDGEKRRRAREYRKTKPLATWKPRPGFAAHSPPRVLLTVD